MYPGRRTPTALEEGQQRAPATAVGLEGEACQAERIVELLVVERVELLAVERVAGLLDAEQVADLPDVERRVPVGRPDCKGGVRAPARKADKQL